MKITLDYYFKFPPPYAFKSTDQTTVFNVISIEHIGSSILVIAKPEHFLEILAK